MQAGQGQREERGGASSHGVAGVHQWCLVPQGGWSKLVPQTGWYRQMRLALLVRMTVLLRAGCWPGVGQCKVSGGGSYRAWHGLGAWHGGWREALQGVRGPRFNQQQELVLHAQRVLGAGGARQTQVPQPSSAEQPKVADREMATSGARWSSTYKPHKTMHAQRAVFAAAAGCWLLVASPARVRLGPVLPQTWSAPWGARCHRRVGEQACSTRAPAHRLRHDSRKQHKHASPSPAACAALHVTLLTSWRQCNNILHDPHRTQPTAHKQPVAVAGEPAVQASRSRITASVVRIRLPQALQIRISWRNQRLLQ
jgi:hypothetical protein